MVKAESLSLLEKHSVHYFKWLILLAALLLAQVDSAFAGLDVTPHTLNGHSKPIYAVAVSPNSNWIASGSGDATIRLWDAATGKTIRILKGHSGPVRSVVFSPDGRHLLSGGDDKTVRLWDVDKGSNTATLKGHEAEVRSVAFSPDGKTVLSGSADTTLKLWDPFASSAILTLEGHIDEVTAVAFSPNGKYVLSGSLDEALRLWEVSSGKEARVYQMHSASDDDFVPIVAVSTVAFSPDGGEILSGADDHLLRLWEVNGGGKPRLFRGHSHPVNAVTFSSDGKYILSGSQGSLKLWGTGSGESIHSWSTESALSVAISNDSRFAVSGERGNSVKVWSLSPYIKPTAVVQSKPKPVTEKQVKLPPVQEPPGSTEKQDILPPTIIITSHDVNRGIITVPDIPEAFVSGRATDDSGIDEVTVNGNSTQLDPSGNFSADVALKPGKNKIEVMARDAAGNIAWKKFWVEGKEVPPLVGTSPPKPMAPVASKNKFHALIIGINDYQNLPKLQTAVHDAREVDKVLRDQYGFTTTLMLDPGREAIMDGFNKIRAEIGPDDNLLIYYAGHGEFDKEVNKAYWLPSDAQPDSDTKWIIVDNITSNIKRMSAKHVLVVADSCYSGTLTRSAITRLRGVKEKQRFLAKMKKRSSRTLMSSGGNEPVSDGGGEGHSIFARAFINALKKPENKEFTAEQLFYDQIKERVAGTAEQVPEYNIIKNSGHKGGDFVFIQK